MAGAIDPRGQRSKTMNIREQTTTGALSRIREPSEATATARDDTAGGRSKMWTGDVPLSLDWWCSDSPVDPLLTCC